MEHGGPKRHSMLYLRGNDYFGGFPNSHVYLDHSWPFLGVISLRKRGEVLYMGRVGEQQKGSGINRH